MKANPNLLATFASVLACSTIEEPREQTPPTAVADPRPATEPQKAPAEAPTLTFHPVVEANTRVLLHPLRSGELFASVGPLVLPTDTAGDFVRDPSWYRGITGIRSPEPDSFIGLEHWDALVVDGVWPDALFMSLDLASGFRSEAAEPVLYRHGKDGWIATSTESRAYTWYPREIRQVGKQVIARRVFEPRFPGHDFESEGEPSERAIEKARREIARANPLVALSGPNKVEKLALSHVDAFDGLPTGELFALEAGEAPRFLRRVGSDERVFDVTIPTGKSLTDAFIIAHGPDEVLLHGALSDDSGRTPFLASCDANACGTLDVPPCKEGVGSYSRAGDEQWLTCSTTLASWFVGEEESLWLSRGGQAWERVPIDGDARQVVARAPGDVFVSVQTGQLPGRLLRSKPPTRVLDTPGIETLAFELFEWGDPLPVHRHCSFALIPVEPSQDEAADLAKLATAFDGLVFRNTVTLEEGELAGRSTWFLRFGFVHDHPQVPVIEARAKKALGARVGAARCLFKEGTRELKAWVLEEE